MPQDPAQVARDRSADYGLSLAANFSATDLTTVVGKPNHAAQLVDFFNAGATPEDAVYTDHKGTVHTKPVPAGGHYPAEIPVASLSASSGANVSAEVYWWCAPGFTINPA